MHSPHSLFFHVYKLLLIILIHLIDSLLIYTGVRADLLYLSPFMKVTCRQPLLMVAVQQC